MSFWVPGGERAASSARRSVLSAQTGLPPEIKHRLALLLSELVTNAIQHGGAGPDETVQVRLATTDEKIRVEVYDPGHNRPHPVRKLEQGGGWGLVLVDKLSDSWGREPTRQGATLAWFELMLIRPVEA